MLGMFAVSKAGHDKGRMYLVIRDEGDARSEERRVGKECT